MFEFFSRELLRVVETKKTDEGSSVFSDALVVPPQGQLRENGGRIDMSIFNQLIDFESSTIPPSVLDVDEDWAFENPLVIKAVYPRLASVQAPAPVVKDILDNGFLSTLDNLWQITQTFSADDTDFDSVDHFYLHSPDRLADSESDPEKKSSLSRVERFQLQSVARSVLGGQVRKQTAKGIKVERYAICHCHRRVKDVEKGVEVYKHDITGKAGYAGLQKCSSVHVCPVCSSRITEIRRKELQTAIDMHVEGGGEVLHMVLTIPHSRFDSLSTILGQMIQAKRDFYNAPRYITRKTVRGIKLPPTGWSIDHGVIGRVDSLEITYGRNGWHPHYHVLLFLDKPLLTEDENEQILSVKMSTLEALKHATTEQEVKKIRKKCKKIISLIMKPYKDPLFEIWETACVAAGLDKPDADAFALQGGNEAGMYVAKFGDEDKGKWVPGAGASMELAKGSNKSARAERSLTPFDMLRNIIAGDDVYRFMLSTCLMSYGCNCELTYTDLFFSYAGATRGKKQLHWSLGLKKRFGLDEKDDDEINTHVDAKDIWLAGLDVDDWRFTMRFGMRARLLDLAEKGGVAAVKEYKKIVSVFDEHSLLCGPAFARGALDDLLSKYN